MIEKLLLCQLFFINFSQNEESGLKAFLFQSDDLSIFHAGNLSRSY